jgi:CBS domain-containing protein
LATRNQRAADICVGEVAQRPVHTCGPDDVADAVLATMRRYRVRRVPVEGFGGTVLGILSLDDLAMAAGPGKTIDERTVIDTLQAIHGGHHGSAHIVAA